MATDLSEICRLCMGRDDVMSRINETRNFAMRVMSVAQVKIAEGDGLPTHICRRCFLRVDAAYDFQEVCWTSDLSLKKRFAYVSVNPVPEVQNIETVVVKEEPPANGNTTDTPRANRTEFISAGTSNNNHNINNTNSQRQDSDLISFESSRGTSVQSSSDEDSDTSETNYLCPNCNKPALSRPTLTPRSTRRAKRRLVYECVSCKKPFRRGEVTRVVGDSLANASKKRKLTDSAAISDVDDVRALSLHRTQESGVEKVDVAVQTMRARKEPGAYAQLSGNEVDDVGALSSRRAQESDVEKVDVAVQTMRARKEPGAYARLSGNEPTAESHKADCVCKDLVAMVSPESVCLIERLVALLKQVMNKECQLAAAEPSPDVLENGHLFADPLTAPDLAGPVLSRPMQPASQIRILAKEKPARLAEVSVTQRRAERKAERSDVHGVPKPPATKLKDPSNGSGSTVNMSPVGSHGIMMNEVTLRKLNHKNYSKLTRALLSGFFTDEYLTATNLTGNPSNRNPDGPRKLKLDPIYVESIIEYVLQFHPDKTVKDVTHVMRHKLNNMGRLGKKLESPRNLEQQ